MKKKDILFIIISAFILVIAWISFNIYHNAITSTIPEATNIQIAPIPKTFDIKTLDELKKREKIAPIFEIQTSPIPVSTSSATQSSQLSTSSATKTP